ncbi:MAG: ATP synthase subunit delta [Planctomycetes bacterium ADurb.Bin401]|nr:MAG: ATP synthase subunit delta [Planctomycetes bacterium ADurb.Bin401]
MITSNLNYNVGEIYGEVLFVLACERGEVETVKADFDGIEKFIVFEGDFIAVLSSPYLSINQKSKLVENIFTGRVCELTLNFLLTAGSHNRLSALPNIIKKYNRLYRQSKGHKDIWMTVSHALDSEEKETVRASLAAALKTENITLEFNVEPEILGGTIIRYAGKMIDNSVRTRLLRAVDTIIAQGRNSAGKSL